MPSAGGRVPEHKVLKSGKVKLSSSVSDDTGLLFGDGFRSSLRSMSTGEIEVVASGVKVAANRAVVSKLVEDPAFKEFVKKNLNEPVFGLRGMPDIGQGLNYAGMGLVHRNIEAIVDQRMGRKPRQPYADHPIPPFSELSKVATLKDVIDAFRSHDDFKDMSDEEVVSSLLVRTVIDNWAGSSTSRPVPQLAAAKVHDTSYESYKQWKTGKGSLDEGGARFAKDEQAMDTVAGDVQKMIVRAEYAATQEWFKERGIKSVTVYRGLSHDGREWKAKDGDIVKLESNPLSSWATDKYEAVRFSDKHLKTVSHQSVVVAMEVPVEAIQSTPFTGRGCLLEFEVVLINKPASALIESVSTLS